MRLTSERPGFETATHGSRRGPGVEEAARAERRALTLLFALRLCDMVTLGVAAIAGRVGSGHHLAARRSHLVAARMRSQAWWLVNCVSWRLAKIEGHADPDRLLLALPADRVLARSSGGYCVSGTVQAIVCT